MKKTGAAVAHLTPGAAGWRLLHAGAPREIAAIEEAATATPPRVHLHLALPLHLAVIERMTLPSTDREELAGMVTLQLEKTLPYAVEETAHDFEVISRGETESTVLAIAVHMEPLEALVAGLRERERMPEKITLFAEHVALACPKDATVLALWPEQGQLIVAVCENANLSWAHPLPATDAATLEAELPGLLLGAEMEGVPVQFGRALVARELPHLIEPLKTALDLPVEILATDAPLPEPDGNLEPAAWVVESEKSERAERTRQRFTLAAMLYLLLVAAAFLYLAWTKRRVQALDAQLAALQPQMQALQAAQARWAALAPAIQPTNYAVELLLLASRNLPNAEVRITRFESSPAQWTVEGEAPSANLAIEYAEKLRAEKELGDWRIEAGPPAILPNEHAQFRIYGKL